jgi:hypothetical protein
VFCSGTVLEARVDQTCSTRRELAPWLTPGRFLGLLAILVLAAFPKVCLGLESFYYRDFGVLGYPFIHYQHESFWRGEIPFWNPLSNCGTPFLAQWGTMTLYPFSLFYLVFPLPWSLTCFCFAHLLLGGLGMYYVAFRWTGSRAGAAVAGTAYVFSGVSFSCLLWPNYTVALAWMPWVLLTAERGWSEGGRRVVLAALVGALQLLAGVPEIVLLTWLVTGALWIHGLLNAPGERLALARRLFLIVGIAAGLAAMQLLPFYDLLLHSHRDRTFSVSKWAMPIWGWGNFFVPLFHCFETSQGPFFQYGQEFFTSYYLGVGVLALAAWGIWKTRQPRVWILGGSALVAVLLALGENGVLFPLVKRFVPLLAIARYPIKFILLPAFAIPLLAAFGISHFDFSPPRPIREQRWFLFICSAFCGLIILVLALAKAHPFIYDQWPATLKNGIIRGLFLIAFAALILLLVRATRNRSRVLLMLALLLIIFADALTHTAQQNPSLPAQIFAPGLWQAHANAPAPRHGQSRVFITPQAEQRLLFNRVQNGTDQFMGERLALWSNLNLLDDIPKVNGSSTLQIREQMLVQKLLYEQTNAFPAGLLDFLSVSHMSSPENLVEWTARTNYCGFITGGQRPEFVDNQTAIHKLVENRFDPRQTVFLPAELRSTLGVNNATEVQITLPEVSNHRVTFQTTAAEASVCVVAQSFYHCWKARIDGTGATLLRANGAFQGMVVPAGIHRITLIYDDLMFWIGLAITAASAFFCVLLWRTQKQKAAGETQAA